MLRGKEEGGISERCNETFFFSVTVAETFRTSEMNLTGEKGFKPHITIMKLSRAPKLRKKGKPH